MYQSIILVNTKELLVFFKKKQCINAKGLVNLKVYIKYILPLILAFQENYKQEIGKPFIYIEDNSSIYRLNATTAAFQARRIPKGFQLTNSLDLNPIKNVWQMLKYQLLRRFLKTNAKVKQYLKEEQEKIRVDNYKKYIKSIRDRCWAVIKAGGGHTK